MRTNLIQSYLNETNASQRYNSDNVKKNFDINRELSNRTFIKPLPSNGELVKNTIFDMPAEFFRDVKYNIKALKHSIKGQANDHELGSLNDMGMQLGGLSIATYLFAMKQTSVVKLMEFVGFGTFFAAMNIWPKFALQLPAYLVHGFNIRQEYRDNFGTKKPVFLDHQFIPWDLYPDEKINKIGDRMGVPKDMKNRRDFIQEKMRKIALQNNTMWMLTSGFATPIMSALLCDILSKPLDKYLAKRQDANAEKLLEHFPDEVAKYDFSQKNKNLSKLLETNKGKPLTPELISEISQAISAGTDELTSEKIKTDLNYLFRPNGYDITKSTFENISNTLTFAISKQTKINELSHLIPTADEIIEKLPENERDLFASGHSKSNIVEFSDYIKVIQNASTEKIQNFAAQNPESKIAKKLDYYIGLFDNIFELKDKNGDLKLSSLFRQIPSGNLTEDNINKIGEINRVLNDFIARQNVLDRYAYIKAAQAPKTSLANSWNEFLNDDMLKIFGISDKEIKQTRMDSKLVHKLIRSKIEDIVADNTRYEQVVKAINDKLCVLEDETKFADFGRYNPDSPNPYKKSVETTYVNAGNELRNLGMNFTRQRLVGYDVNTQMGEVDVHTLKDLQMSFLQDRVLGVKSSFYRILNTLDMFKRVSSLNYEDFFGPIPRQSKEEMVEMCKELLIGGHSSDYAEKFYFRRNTDLNPKFDSPEAKAMFEGPLERKDGRVVYRYVSQTGVGLSDMPYDIDFYQKSMKLMYNQNLHDATYNKIKDSVFYENFIKYRNEMFAYHGGNRYFAKPYHYADGKKIDSTSEFRFNLLGSSLDDMFAKLFSTKYNSKKWMSMFGGLGVALLGITVLSQFFMGKMPVDKKVQGGKK